MLEFKYVIGSIHSDFPEDDGCCFGTLDPSRLRKPFSRPYRIKYEEPEFELGGETLGISVSSTGSIIKCLYKDVHLTDNLKARIITQVSANKKAEKEFLEDKIAFSDLETREEYYIYKLF